VKIQGPTPAEIGYFSFLNERPDWL